MMAKLQKKLIKSNGFWKINANRPKNMKSVLFYSSFPPFNLNNEFDEFDELLTVFINFTKGRKRPSNFTNCKRSQNSFNSSHL